MKTTHLKGQISEVYCWVWVLPIKTQYNTKETANPENQDNLYKASKEGIKYPIKATATPPMRAIMAAGLKPAE